MDKRVPDEVSCLQCGKVQYPMIFDDKPKPRTPKFENLPDDLPPITGRPDTKGLYGRGLHKVLAPWLREQRELVELYIYKVGSMASQEAFGIGNSLWYQVTHEWGLVKPSKRSR
jgi:hypothetical protein